MRFWKSKKRRRHEEILRELGAQRRAFYENQQHATYPMIDNSYVIPQRDPKRMKATLDTLNAARADKVALPQARCNYGQRTEDPYCGESAVLVRWNTSMASEDGPRCRKHYARVYKSHVCVGEKKPVCIAEGCSERAEWVAWGRYFSESLKGAVCPSHAAEALSVTTVTDTFASAYAIERL